MFDNQSTIIARATALGTAGIAVIRISGPDAVPISGQLFSASGGHALADIAPRRLVNGVIHDGDAILDHCLAVRFEGPSSFTGEDVVEFHVHGNMRITERVVELGIMAGARHATAGEFTQRAFLNGKIDLTQVEALADVIAVESQTALLIAQRQFHGELRSRLDSFRDQVIDLLALLELELDFVQEGYQFAPVERVNAVLDDLRVFVEGLLHSYRAGNRLRLGPRILLLGKPNAGKSSLFNLLVGYSRALVSPIPGTTRDYLEERVDYNGVQFRFVDTAGLRSTDDLLEAAGVERARDLVALADHVFYLIDGTRSDSYAEELEYVDRLRGVFRHTTFSVVLTKSDLEHRHVEGTLACSIYRPDSALELLDGLVNDYRQDLAESVALVNQRQHQHLCTIRDILAGVRYDAGLQTELLSADLRALLVPLSELTGAVVSDDILTRLFSSFCIGK